jgi:hypothetical protein
MPIDTSRLLAIQDFKRDNLLNAWTSATNGVYSGPGEPRDRAADLIEWLLSMAGCRNKFEYNNQSTDTEIFTHGSPVIA